MKCPQCGAQVAATGWCHTCGTFVMPVATANSPDDEETQTSVTPTPNATFNQTRYEPTVATRQTLGDASGPGEANTGPLAVGQAFGARYHVIKVLGVGGMGAVYQVWDAELAQGVALKVIRPEAAGDPACRQGNGAPVQTGTGPGPPGHPQERRPHSRSRRNQRHQVHHDAVPRGIGSRHGVEARGQAAACPGRFASSVTSRPGSWRRTKPASCIAISSPRTSCSSRDHAIIMDFGIARSATGQSSAQRPDRRAPTRPGASGTATRCHHGGNHPRNDQVHGAGAGERGNGRSARRLYALGLIFSDMLLGARPGRATDALEELQRRMEHAPPPVRTVDSTIPEAIDRLISRCLHPDPAKRYQTTNELVADLDRLDRERQADSRSCGA